MGILCTLLGHNWRISDFDIDEYAVKSRMCERCLYHEFLNPKSGMWEDAHTINKEDYLKTSEVKVNQ